MRNPKLMYPLVGVLVIVLGVVAYLLVGQKRPSKKPAARVAATQKAEAGAPAEAGAKPSRKAEAGTEKPAASATAAAEKGTEVARGIPPYQPLSEEIPNPFRVQPEPELARPETPMAAPPEPSPPKLPPLPEVPAPSVPPVQVTPPGQAPMPVAQPPIEPTFNWKQFANQGARRRPSPGETRPLSVTGTVVGSDGKAAAILTDGSQRLLVRTGQRVNVGGRAMEVLSVDRGSVVLQEDQRRIALEIGGGNR